RWAEIWKERLARSEPFILEWLRHPVDGDYWRSASLRPHYQQIECPVFLIAGWRDGYINAMLRTFVNLDCPKNLLAGPWTHQRPNASVPGPCIDHFNEMARFFLQHLAEVDTGFDADPPVRVYLQQDVEPDRTARVTPGHWREEDTFPGAGADTALLASAGIYTNRRHRE